MAHSHTDDATMVPSLEKIKAPAALSARPKGFRPFPYYRHAWEILKKDPLVFLWKVLSDFFGRMTSFALLALLGSLLFIDLTLFLDSGRSPLSWFAHVTDVARSPLFLAGLSGILLLVLLLKLAVESFVVGGIWGVIAVGLHGEPIPPGTTFGSRALQHFPDVLTLLFLRLALRTLASLLIVGVGIAIFFGYNSGSLGELSTFTQSCLIAAALTSWMAWFALTRLTIEVVAAPMIIDDVPLGEAILDAADFVISNFWALYRLLIFSLGLLLLPLFGYWIVLMVNNLTLIWPALTPIAMVLRIISEILLWISISFLGVLFYGALFSFFRSGQLDTSTGEPQPPSPDKGKKGTFATPYSLNDLLPASSPHRFHFDELFHESPDHEALPFKQEPSEDNPEQPTRPTSSNPTPEGDGEPFDPDAPDETDRSTRSTSKDSPSPSDDAPS